jgi:hypothetical protein
VREESDVGAADDGEGDGVDNEEEPLHAGRHQQPVFVVPALLELWGLK